MKRLPWDRAARLRYLIDTETGTNFNELPNAVTLFVDRPVGEPTPRFNLVAVDKDGNGLYCRAEGYKQYVVHYAGEHGYVDEWTDSDSRGRPFSPPSAARWRWLS